MSKLHICTCIKPFFFYSYTFQIDKLGKLCTQPRKIPENKLGKSNALLSVLNFLVYFRSKLQINNKIKVTSSILLQKTTHKNIEKTINLNKI